MQKCGVLLGFDGIRVNFVLLSSRKFQLETFKSFSVFKCFHKYVRLFLHNPLKLRTHYCYHKDERNRERTRERERDRVKKCFQSTEERKKKIKRTQLNR